MDSNTSIPPAGLGLWTADEVAECLGYQMHLKPVESDILYSKLWAFVSEAKNPTPLGGDGGYGTVETPCGRLNLDNDDKANHWWSQLVTREREAIAAAWAKLGGGL